MAFTRSAEHGFKLPMRAKSNKSSRLLSAVSLQDSLYCRLEVVVPDAPENPSKAPECQFMGLEKCLLSGPWISSVKGSATSHTPHLKYLQASTLTPKIRISLIPIHLSFRSPGIALRHACLASYQSQRQPALSNILANRPLADVTTGDFLLHPLPDPMRRMSLLSRSATVGLQHDLNQGNKGFKLPVRSVWPFARHWYGAADCLPDHPPMNAKLSRYTPNRSFSEFILPSDALKQLHLGPPIQASTSIPESIRMDIRPALRVGPN